MQFERHIAVGEDPLIFYGLDHHSSRHSRQTIGIDGVRVLEDLLLEIALVGFMRDDRNPLGSVTANTAGVVEMVVRIDKILDRLGRKYSLGFFDRFHCSIVSSFSFGNDQVIFEFYEQALGRSHSQEPDAVGDLLGSDTGRPGTFTAARASTTSLRIAGDFTSGGTVRFDFGNRDIEDGMTPLALHDMHRKLHAAEIFIVGVKAFENRVACQSSIDFGLDMFDQVLFVDCTCDDIYRTPKMIRVWSFHAYLIPWRC